MLLTETYHKTYALIEGNGPLVGCIQTIQIYNNIHCVTFDSDQKRLSIVIIFKNSLKVAVMYFYSYILYNILLYEL